MKKIVLISGAVLLVAAAALIVHLNLRDRGRLTTAPEFSGLARSATGNDLVSDHDPAVTLRFAPDFKHIGGQKFVLYGVADTEQHFFIEENENGQLSSVYWIQFEAYLPGKRYKYDYSDSPLRLQLGEYEFYADTAVVRPDPTKRRSGTDGAMARQFLQSKGYSYPGDFSYARLVYLTDASRQKELMIIFIDDLAQYGLTAPELKEGGSAAERWPEVEEQHLEKIRSTLQVFPK